MHHRDNVPNQDDVNNSSSEISMVTDTDHNHHLKKKRNKNKNNKESKATTRKAIKAKTTTKVEGGGSQDDIFTHARNNGANTSTSPKLTKSTLKSSDTSSFQRQHQHQHHLTRRWKSGEGSPKVSSDRKVVVNQSKKFKPKNKNSASKKSPVAVQVGSKNTKWNHDDDKIVVTLPTKVGKQKQSIDDSSHWNKSRKQIPYEF